MVRTYKLMGDRFDSRYRAVCVVMMHTDGDVGDWGTPLPTYEIREPFARAVAHLEVACGIRSEEAAAQFVRWYSG